MNNKTEKPLSPLHSSWAERHADECDFVLVGPIDVVGHAKSEDEIVSDFVRNDKPYLNLKAYRKTIVEAVSQNPGEGPWIMIEGLKDISMRTDQASEVLRWFPIFSKSSEKKLHLYEQVDIRSKVQAIYDKREAEARAKLERERQRKDANDVATIMSAIRNGAESIDDISEGCHMSFARIETLVNRLVIQGKIESVDYQPPVIKVLRIKGV